VVVSNVAADLPQFRQALAVGLRNIEDVGRAETTNARVFCVAMSFSALFVGLAPDADDGSEDANAFLALLRLASELVPRPQASDASRIRLLPCDFEDVAKGKPTSRDPFCGHLFIEQLVNPG